MYRTTADFIQLLKDEYGLTSNYKVAQFLGKTDTQVAHWTKGRHTFDDSTALIIAEALKIDPAEIMTCCQIERAEKQGKFDVAGVYRKMLFRLEGALTAGAAAVFGLAILAPYMAAIPSPF
ncbi:helix-turn-helix domain-containing protein [Saccharospirillum salsuginis]|uniref:HTH cro/C1-type domain-containing protein n=1 Tax=Saccharospirillum salsuginis TaxID=418750 RepID=A0A918K6K0_9GAMM|nr:helix-turn-helix transcriptional regulator [Saccharospirillum salsuginis]GGX52224.1 hypothetical protein GCM10007392_19440 [Saccharospirillum salsuginis]